MDTPNHHMTMTGKVRYSCDTAADQMTLDLFMELLRNMRPVEVQDEIKRIIKERKIKCLY